MGDEQGRLESGNDDKDKETHERENTSRSGDVRARRLRRGCEKWRNREGDNDGGNEVSNENNEKEKGCERGN